MDTQGLNLEKVIQNSTFHYSRHIPAISEVIISAFNILNHLFNLMCDIKTS